MDAAAGHVASFVGVDKDDSRRKIVVGAAVFGLAVAVVVAAVAAEVVECLKGKG